ncbi:MAG: spore coat protein U domain-containing protein [Gallionella sp.]|nr:spore coat protein U domain-containing protein [Gallionella sp.]
MKKSLLTASMFSTGLAFSGIAQAVVVASSTLNVSATVAVDCTVTTTAVNFGNLNATNTTFANGDISVNCTPGVPYHIALDAGLNLDAFGFRNLKQVAGTAAVEYVLSSVSTPFVSEWGDADLSNTISRGASVADIGNGLSQPHTVYGASDVVSGHPTGAYTDIVNVTVFY